MALVKAKHDVFGEVMVPASKVEAFPHDYKIVKPRKQAVTLPAADPVDPVIDNGLTE